MTISHPAPYTLRIRQGHRFERPFIWKDSDGNVHDLTGYTARAQIRRTADAPGDPIWDGSTSNGKIVIDGPAGKVTLIISAVDSAAFDFGEAVWDLELLPGGVEADAFALLAGEVELTKQVTR